MDILIYNVDLDSDHIQSYSKSNDFAQLSNDFMKVLSIPDDIVIQPTIFIFHGVNSIYFIFKENDRVGNSHNHTIKSILKNTGNGNDSGVNGGKHPRTTKRVHIIEPSRQYMRKTKRRTNNR